MQGLQQAHSKGVLHRDIKPANLLLNRDKQVKIVDFGISKSLMEDDPNLTKENHFIGTLTYMAPEILTGHPPTPASDIFSVGIVYYELLTGKNPFFDTNKIKVIDRIRTEQVELPEDIKPLIPEPLQQVIHKMVHLDKSQRFQSCQEAIHALQSIRIEDLPEFHGISLLSASQKSEALHVSRHSLLMAIDDFEKSKSQTQSSLKFKETELFGESQTSAFESVDFVGPKTKTKTIPFPLFQPKYLLRFMLIIGFIGINVMVATTTLHRLGIKATPRELLQAALQWGSSKEEKSSQEASGPSLSEAGMKPLQTAKQATLQSKERNLSSTPNGLMKHLPTGTVLQYQRSKYNAKTGEYLFNQKDVRKIMKIENDQMLAYYKDGKTGTWSSQKLSKNAFLPPLQKYSKRPFKIAVKPSPTHADLYPIELNREAQFTFQEIHKGGLLIFTEQKCRVSKEVTQIVAGENRTLFEVDCELKTDKSTEFGKFYYSPDWNLIVKKETTHKTPKGEFVESFELQSITIPK